jgi:hypothetical protein
MPDRSPLKHLFLLLFLFACQESRQPAEPTAAEPPTDSQAVQEPSEDATLLKTDREEYLLQQDGSGYSVTIGYAYTNRTGGPVYLSNCNGDVSPAVQRLEGGEWQVAWSPVMNECLSLPVVIPDSGAYRNSVRLFVSPQDGDTYTDFLSERKGNVYRLIWGQAYSSFDMNGYPFGEPLPLDQKVSNAFRLAVQR